jgi:hypothetical protein
VVRAGDHSAAALSPTHDDYPGRAVVLPGRRTTPHHNDRTHGPDVLRDNAGLPVVNESLPGGALVKTLNERPGARTLPQARCRKTPTPA